MVTICTAAEASPIHTILGTMRTDDVNDFVVRLYDHRHDGSFSHETH